jgi:WD40 repeat protein
MHGESPSTAHKRHATTPQDESPLPSASSSMAQASSLSSSVPKIPLDLIADLVLPFVADRVTWNSVCCASKELYLAGKKKTPPWPNTIIRNFGRAVRNVAFSPSGSQLAFNVRRDRLTVYVWDRWGKKTILLGIAGPLFSCLKYSSDGEHLASNSFGGSIHVWHTESFHSTSSKISRQILTRTPAEACTILPDHRPYDVMALAFSRTDSNLLASGSKDGVINLWNVKEQARIHTFGASRGLFQSLSFVGGDKITCFAATSCGSIIRLWKPEGSVDFTSDVMVEYGLSERRPCGAFSPCGSVLAFSVYSRKKKASTVSLYALESMTKIQSVVIPRCRVTYSLAFSPDSKTLVLGDCVGGIRLLETDDLSIQRDIDAIGLGMQVCAVAVDPTCRVLAFSCHNGRLELRTL